MDKWEKVFGIAYPQCNMCGCCCTMASPSSPYDKMLEKAAQGDQNARDFLNLFIPYTPEEKKSRFSLEYIEKCRQMALKSNKFESPDQVEFYHCRFIGENNACLVYEDRPELCRSYPDTPFILMPPGCAYQEWSKTCKNYYFNMGRELELLKSTQSLLKASDEIILKAVIFASSRILVSPAKTWVG